MKREIGEMAKSTERRATTRVGKTTRAAREKNAPSGLGARLRRRFRLARRWFGARISENIKYRFPALWRSIYGFQPPQSGVYEDFCENVKPIVLAKDQLGRDGERYVFSELAKNPKHRMLACNTENYYCEIDIVFLDLETKEIVFVEVKTRRRDDARFPHALYSVDAKRRKKLALAAREFVKERGYFDFKKRFDVAVLYMPRDGAPDLQYHKSAFHFANAMVDYKKNDFGKSRGVKRLREDLKRRAESKRNEN